MQGKKINITQKTIAKLFRHGSSMIVFAIALLGTLIILNYMVAINFGYFDITKDNVHSLSSSSRKLMKEIDFPVNIKAFYLSKNHKRIKTMLEEYQNQNDLINFEVIDPLQSPVIAEKYNVRFPRTIIFEAEDKSTRLDPPPPRKVHTELELTTSFYRLITDDEKKAYFSTGHGELSILNTRPDGINLIAARLREQNFIVESLNFQDNTTVPKDCDVLILANPTTPFLDEEIRNITTYLIAGGSVITTLTPGIDSRINELLEMVQLTYGNNFVYETASDRTTRRGPTAPICIPYDPSEITDQMETQNFLMPGVRSIELKGLNENITHYRLLATSNDSWAETDIESIMESNKRPVRDDDEQKGPIMVAVASEINAKIPTEDNMGVEERIIRSAFFGSALFMTNAIVSQFPANLELFARTVNWITRNERIIEVTPNSVVFTPVELTHSERRWISWLTMFIFPASILLFGVLIWYRKR